MKMDKEINIKELINKWKKRAKIQFKKQKM